MSRRRISDGIQQTDFRVLGGQRPSITEAVARVVLDGGGPRSVDRVLEQIGWSAARRALHDALRQRGIDLADDRLDALTEQAVTIADRGHLDFDLVAETFARVVRIATTWRGAPQDDPA